MRRGQSTVLIVFGLLIVIVAGAGVIYITDNSKKNNAREETDPSPTTISAPSSTQTPTSTPNSVPTAVTPETTLTRTPTITSTTTATATVASTKTPQEENNYTNFLNYLSGHFRRTGTPLRIRGIQIYETNDTMWVVYNGTDAEKNDTARQTEWAVIARSYGFALRSHERRNARGETPILMKVVEANTSKNPESTFKISSGMARLYAYNNITAETYTEILFQSLRTTTESEQRKGKMVDRNDRDIIFYPNGTWKFIEPPESAQENDATTETTSTPNARLTRPVVAARSAG